MKDFDNNNNVSSTVDFQSYNNADYTFQQDKRNTRDIVQWLPQYLKDMSCDYKIFFSTITFKDTPIKASIDNLRSFLTQSCMRMNNLVCHSKNYSQSCKFLYFPENTYKKLGQVKRNNECHHVHGFIFVHKQKYDKFYKKSVEDIVDVETDTMGVKEDYKLNERILIPYSQATLTDYCNYDQYNRDINPETLLLWVQETRIHLVEDIDQFMATSRYSSKKFKKDFKYEDMLEITKIRPNKY